MERRTRLLTAAAAVLLLASSAGAGSAAQRLSGSAGQPAAQLLSSSASGLTPESAPNPLGWPRPRFLPFPLLMFASPALPAGAGLDLNRRMGRVRPSVCCPSMSGSANMKPRSSSLGKMASEALNALNKNWKCHDYTLFERLEKSNEERWKDHDVAVFQLLAQHVVADAWKAMNYQPAPSAQEQISGLGLMRLVADGWKQHDYALFSALSSPAVEGVEANEAVPSNGIESGWQQHDQAVFSALFENEELNAELAAEHEQLANAWKEHDYALFNALFAEEGKLAEGWRRNDEAIYAALFEGAEGQELTEGWQKHDDAVYSALFEDSQGLGLSEKWQQHDQAVFASLFEGQAVRKLHSVRNAIPELLDGRSGEDDFYDTGMPGQLSYSTVTLTRD